MPIDRRSLIAGASVLGAALPRLARAAAGPVPALREPAEAIPLWPGVPPGAPAVLPVETITERSAIAGRPDRIATGIAVPRLLPYRPERPNGAAVLVIPGGGYRQEAFDNSGTQIAAWLAGQGFHAFVLLYRLPGEGWADRANVPLADAQRAMRLIRQRAGAWGFAPERVGVMGFSAGGHVCADLAARFAARVYASVDPADGLPARPFCAAPIYPVVSMDPAIAHPGSRALLLGDAPGAALEAAHSPDRTVTAAAPPHFLVHAEDDATVPVANTLHLRAALRSAGVPVETHLFVEGGHGFGLARTAGLPVDAWPELWLGWARRTGLA